MSERKNIDRLFQEKFKDFEVNPPEIAWDNIEAKLDGKKKKRAIPFWWKLSGVAAVFLIGFMVSKSIYDDNDIQPDANSVVNQENANPKTENNTGRLNKNGKIQTENAVANEENLKDPKDVNSLGSNQNKIKDNGQFRNENAVANKNEPNKSEKSNPNKTLKNNAVTSSDAVATTSGEKKTNGVASERKNKFRTVITSESVVAERKLTNKRSLKNKANPDKNKTATSQSVFEKSENPVAQNSNQNKDNTKSNVEKGIAQNQTDKTPKTAIDTKNISLDGLKGESNSKIIAQETVKKVNDTAAKNSVVSNALEELLNEKESKQKQESKRNRWQLTSNVAPVFLGSVAKGSPIDPTLSTNSKSTTANLGYGLGVSYGVSKKLAIRTGLNKVNVSYNTNDISFFTAIQARTMQNVKPTASSASIQIQSSASPSATTTGGLGSEAQFLPFENSITHKNSGYLKQEMGYLEMPVEMTYNLIDKKFGVKIIGGISTLFLQDNRITIISENRDTELGEASNLSDVHFSTNLGLGIKYSFMKSFEFNIEPTFKYQLNTYTGNAGNFKPYILGIYSGISYKF